MFGSCILIFWLVSLSCVGDKAEALYFSSHSQLYCNLLNERVAFIYHLSRGIKGMILIYFLNRVLHRLRRLFMCIWHLMHLSKLRQIWKFDLIKINGKHLPKEKPQNCLKLESICKISVCEAGDDLHSTMLHRDLKKALETGMPLKKNISWGSGSHRTEK